MPGESGGDADEELMVSIRAVIEYTGLNLTEVLDLPCDMFLLCYKNWAVERLSMTKEGQNYLEQCRIARQTTPDWDMVHRIMKEL